MWKGGVSSSSGGSCSSVGSCCAVGPKSWLAGEVVLEDESVLAENLSRYLQRAWVESVLIPEDESPLKMIGTEGK